MKLAVFIVATLLAACSPPPAIDILQRLDSRIQMPEGADDIGDYDRFYAKTDDGWRAVFVSTIAGQGRAKLTKADDLPEIADGECGVIEVKIDKQQNFLTAFCHGGA